MSGPDRRQRELLASLTEQEAAALVSAASWYASYHHAAVQDAWDDQSAAERTRRESFLALHEGLRKLGIRRPGPAPVTEVVEI